MNRNQVLVIVPAYNEESTIQEVVEELCRNNYSVLVVSDGSTDNTAALATASGAQVLNLAANLGVGGALRAGFRFACQKKYQAVVQVDADGQHPIGAIQDLIDAAEDNQAHLVIGSRFLTDETSMHVGKMRRFVMYVLAWSASRATQTPITDATSGFRIITQPLLEEFSHSFPVNYLGDTYEALISAGRAGYLVCEIPAPMRSRLVGESSAKPFQALKFTLKALGIVFLRLSPRLAEYKRLS